MRYGVLAAVGLVLALAVAVLPRLDAGLLRVEGMSDRVRQVIGEALGGSWSVALRDSSLTFLDGRPALNVVGLDIRNSDGVLIARAPHATVSLDVVSLLGLSLRPYAIEFRDVHLRGRIARDGSISIIPPAEDGAVAMPQAAPDRRIVPDAQVGTDAGVDASTLTHPQLAALTGGVNSLFRFILDGSGVTGALESARATNVSLVLLDEVGRERVAFERVDLDLDREDRRRTFTAHIAGPGGRWSVSGSVEATQDAGRQGRLDLNGMPVRDLLLLSGLSTLAGAKDLQLSGSAHLAFGAAGELRRFDVQLGSNAGRITTSEPDLPFINVDAISLTTRWDPDRATLVVEDARYRAGRTDVRLAGELVEGDARDWRLTLLGRDAVIGGVLPGDEAFRVGEISVKGRGNLDGVVLDELSLRGPDLDVALALSLGTPEDRGGLRIALKAGPMPARNALRLWPDFVAAKPRQFLVEKLEAGRLKSLSLASVLTGETLKRLYSHKGLPDDALNLDFELERARLGIAEGLPPLSDVDASGHVTGKRVALSASSARLPLAGQRSLSVREGSFAMADVWAERAMADVNFRLEGGADALATYLMSPALKSTTGLTVDPARVSGQAELKVHIPLAVDDVPPIPKIPIVATGRLTDLGLDGVAGKEKLEAGALVVAYDTAGLSLKGEARIGGSPATVDLKQPRGGGGEAVVTLVLDEAARNRRNLSLGSQLSGPVSLRIAAPLGREKAPVRIEADLTRAAIDDAIPGWNKAAGRAAKLAFVLPDGEFTTVEDIHLDSGATQIRGSADFDQDGNLVRADLPTFRLSTGDEARVEVERGGKVLKVALRGNTLDARPFLDGLSQAGSAPSRGKDPARDVDLDLSVNILSGHNSEALTRATLKASLRGGEVTDVQLNGRFPQAPVRARVGKREGSSNVLLVESADAGAFLRFLDLYRRMYGGSLVFQIGLGGPRQSGVVHARDFVLRDEPALRRIVAQQTNGASTETRTGAQLPPIDVNQVAFTRAKAEFQRTGGRIDFREAVIWGDQIGFTLSGFLDPGRDRTDIQGTFVPAYGLNNVFAQVPLFGPILGGGQYEGLFGVNFRVSGSLKNPSLTVNPLSAIAPGFLRKLFGAGGGNEAVTPPMPGER